MAASSLDPQTPGSLSSSSNRSSLGAAATAAAVSSIMETPYHHHHHYQPDIQPISASFNGNSNNNTSTTTLNLEQNTIPAHYNSYNYLSSTNINNHTYPFAPPPLPPPHSYHYSHPASGSNYSPLVASNGHQSEHYYSVAAAAAAAAATTSTTNEYQANSYATAINNHHDNNNSSNSNNNNDNQSSSLNTPTLDQTVSSPYYPATFQQQQPSAAAAAASTPTYQTASDYYFPNAQYQHPASDITGSLYNHSVGGHESSLFACPSQYPHHTSYLSSSAASQSLHEHPASCQAGQNHLRHQPSQHHGSTTSTQQRTLAMDRAQVKRTAASSAASGGTNPSVPACQTTRVGISGNHLPALHETSPQQQKQMGAVPQGPRQSNQHHQTMLQLKLNDLRTTSVSASESATTNLHPGTNNNNNRHTTNCLANSTLPAAADNSKAAQSAQSMITKNSNSKIQQRGSTHKAARTSGLGAVPTAQPSAMAGGGAGGSQPMISRRKNATRETTATLKDWLDEHDQNPYPTKGEKIMLSIITKMSLTQVSTWFANARRRMKKENKLFWGSTGKQGNQPLNSDGSPNLQGANRGANRGTASIRYFIHKHQKQLAGASSMLALAGHRIQGRPFVYCPHIQSSSYSKQQPAAAAAASCGDANEASTLDHHRQPKATPPKASTRTLVASSASASNSATQIARTSTTTVSSSSSGSPSSSSSGLYSPIATTTTSTMKPAVVATAVGAGAATTSNCPRAYDDTYGIH